MKVSIHKLLNDLAEALRKNPIVPCTRHSDGRKNSQEDEKLMIAKWQELGFNVAEPGDRTTSDVLLVDYPNTVLDLKSIKLTSVKKDRSNASSSPKAFAQLLDPNYNGPGKPNWGHIGYITKLTGPTSDSHFIVLDKETPSQVIYRSIKHLHEDTFQISYANVLQLDWVNEAKHTPTERTDDEFRKVILDILNKWATENVSRMEPFMKKDN